MLAARSLTMPVLLDGGLELDFIHDVRLVWRLVDKTAVSHAKCFNYAVPHNLGRSSCGSQHWCVSEYKCSQFMDPTKHRSEVIIPAVSIIHTYIHTYIHTTYTCVPE